MKGWRVCLCGLMLLALSCAGAIAQQNRSEETLGFADFRQVLEKTLIASGQDPQRQGFHFVIMINTVRTQGLGAQQMRNVYYGLLKRYLVEGSDRISFVPFQLGVRDEFASWNRPYSRSISDEFYRLLPTSPESRNGDPSGHDSEAALLAAVQKVDTPESAIYLMLSDAEVSATPRSNQGYSLTGSQPLFRKTLKQNGIEEKARGRITSAYPRKTGDISTYYATMYYRIYLPANLKPLSAVRPQTRDQLAALQPKEGPGDVPAGDGAENSRHPGGSSSGTEHPGPKHNGQQVAGQQGATEPGRTSALPIILGIVAVVVALVIVFYALSTMNRSHGVQVNNATGTIRRGQRLYVGGEGSAPNLIIVPEVAKGQKIAALEIEGAGNVILRGEGLFTFAGSGKIVLKPTPQTVVVKNTHTRETVCQLSVKTIS